MSLLTLERQATTARTRTAVAWWWRHPEVPAVAAILAAWIVLAVVHWANHDQVATDAWSFGVASWSLMVVAMMLPGSLPMQRRVAFNSLWHRRHRSSTIFAATYVGAWIVLGVAGLVLVSVAEGLTGWNFNPGRFEVAAVLVAASAWQFTSTKRRALRRCHLRTPLAPRGWKADRSIIRYGWFHAKACIGSCFPLMAAMFVGAHDFHLMAPLAAISIVERYQQKPNAAASAAGILAVAALTLFF